MTKTMQLHQKDRKCSILDCGRPLRARGYCAGHYRRLRNGEDLNAPMTTPKKITGDCTVENCESPQHAKGYCNFHYNRAWRGTTSIDAPRKFLGEWGEWYLNSNGYLERTRRLPVSKGRGPKERQYQHRVVMEEILGRPLLPEENVHHKNGDRKDNRPENLELWSTSQPPGQRVEDKVKWAKEIINLYETATQ